MLQLANMILPEDENFLLVFRREAALDNSVDFMQVKGYFLLCVTHLSTLFQEEITALHRLSTIDLV